MSVVTAFLLSSALGAIAEEKAPVEAYKAFELRHPGVLHVGGDVKGPKLRHKVDPKWPDRLKLRFQELSPIIVEAVVSESGEVLDPTIVGTAHPVG